MLCFKKIIKNVDNKKKNMMFYEIDSFVKCKFRVIQPTSAVLSIHKSQRNASVQSLVDMAVCFMHDFSSTDLSSSHSSSPRLVD